jgi:hypothetical protein
LRGIVVAAVCKQGVVGVRARMLRACARVMQVAVSSQPTVSLRFLHTKHVRRGPATRAQMTGSRLQLGVGIAVANVGGEVLAVRTSAHETLVNGVRDAVVLVDASVVEFDLERRTARVISDRGEAA